MRKYMLFFFVGFLFSTNGTAQDKFANFPKTVEYPKQMPSRQHFWIFIMAGQSNMAGRGIVEPKDTLPNPRILTVNLNNEWVVAKEPLHHYQPKITGLDCGVSFASELLNNLDDSISIGLIPCAIGGSPIRAWESDSMFNGIQLFSNFKEKVSMASEYGEIKGIIWHQGESDAFPEKIPLYKYKLEAVLTNMRKFIGNDSLSIIMGELGLYTRPQERQENWNAINDIIRAVPHNLKNCYVVPTGDLSCNPDSIHFNAQSQRILGKRYAEKFISSNSSIHKNK
jgi:hypothetical protein